MCGICGFSWRDEDKVRSMTDALRHRGPDDCGHFVDDQVSLGHTRLSVLDLTETGRQPMVSDDGNVILTFNGEIYNFQEIRAELVRLGHIFRGTSDTEVFLRSYLEWGKDALSRFNGMWAASIYDKRKGALILSRDRIGVKPLYYHVEGGQLIFASEIKSILRHDVRRRVNRAAVDILLSSQFVPSPLSIFDGIFKVEPRQCVTWDIRSKVLSKEYYYKIPEYRPIQDKKKLLKMGRELLEDAVRIRLVADVPVGAFLSGGIDSTTVVAEMRRRVEGDKLHTVSVGFELPGLDESEYIEIARREYATNHHHILFRTNDVEGMIEDIARVYDEPVADPSSFPTMLLCEQTRRWMTVALSGDGGDEIFGGYGTRQVVAQFVIIRSIPRFLRKIAHAALLRCYGYRATRLGQLCEALRVSLLDASEYCAEIGATLVYRPEAFKEWSRSKLRELLPLSGGNLVEAMLKFDIYYNRLGDNYAAKVDRMSMAHALEVRSPFLDYRFMEYASRIPVRWKLTSRRTKILMKEMIRGIIPDQIIDREKHGFAGPLGAWISANEDAMKSAVTMLTNAGVLDEKWKSFYLEKVFVERNGICGEYKKRLFFLWKWYEAWVAKADAPSAAVTAGTETSVTEKRELGCTLRK